MLQFSLMIKPLFCGGLRDGSNVRSSDEYPRRLDGDADFSLRGLFTCPDSSFARRIFSYKCGGSCREFEIDTKLMRNFDL